MGLRRHRRGRKGRDTFQIASERIAILFEQAEIRARKGQLDLADRYVELARAIGMRYNVRFPRALKSRSCKTCGVYFVAGRNLRVRVRPGTVVRTCLKCGAVSRQRTAPREAPSTARTVRPEPESQEGGR